MKMKQDAKGCVHVHIKNGKVVNAFSHLTNFPNDAVIHLKPDAILSIEKFKETHPIDAQECEVEPEQRIYQLGDNAFKKEC